jgi:hypothetical protein
VAIQKTRFALLPLLLLALLAIVAACGGYDSTDTNGSGGDNGSGQPGDRDESVSSDPGGGAESSLPATVDRKIVRTANMALAVEDIPGAVRRIEQETTASGGFVSNSSIVTESEDTRATAASLTIRVPAESYSATMEQLRGLATAVRAESSQTSEVTEEYTDLQSRLRNLQATEARYLALLETAASMEDILAVQDRLNGVRGEIEQVTGRINALDDLTDLATINIELALPAAGEAGETQHWAVRAWEASWEVSGKAVVVLGSVGIGLAVLVVWVVPLAIIGLLAWVFFGRRIVALAQRIGAAGAQPPPASPAA